MHTYKHTYPSSYIITVGINNYYEHSRNCHNPRTKNARHERICKLNVARNSVSTISTHKHNNADQSQK